MAESEWAEFSNLYKSIDLRMKSFEIENNIKKHEYSIYDGDNGSQIKVSVSDLRYIKESLVEKLRSVMLDFPQREIVYTVLSPAKDTVWPDMGLLIRKDIIIDGLQRQYFPPEYQAITYTGSRPGDLRDSIAYTPPNPEFALLSHKVNRALGAIAAQGNLGPGPHYMVLDQEQAGEEMVLAAKAPLMQPDAITELQTILRSFPRWTILIIPDRVPNLDDPAMFVEVRHDEIVDRLDRSRLPRDYANLHYPGARRAKPFRIPASLLR